MRKNRKISKRMSRVTAHTMHIGAIILTVFVMVVLNLMASSSCSQLTKSIADKEMELASEKTELEKNIINWDAEKSSVNLDRALVSRGMSMNYPRPSQIVQMSSSGKVLPGQNSVAILRRKKKDSATANYGGSQVRTENRRVIR